MDAEEVDAVMQAAREKAVRLRQLVAPQPFGLQTGVGGRVEVQFAHGGIAKTLAHHLLQFALGEEAEGDARLRHPLTPGNRVVVKAHTGLGGKPGADVVAQVHISLHFMIALLAALLVGRFQYLARRPVGVSGMAVDVLIVEAEGE